MQHFDSQLWPDTAALDTAGLSLGGVTTADLVRQWGTPLYALDSQTLASTAARFRESLAAAYPGRSSVHYAGKALLNTPLAQLITRLGLGLDCVSLGELAVARRAGADLTHVHLHGNAKPRHELEQALQWGVGRIIIDSLDELHTLRNLTHGRATPQPILLRVNPGVDVHTHAHIQTGQLDSKFGLPIATGMAEEAAAIILQSPGLKLVGLHAHLGSQIAAFEPLRLGVERLTAFAADLRDRYGWTLEELSPGGGLAVPYRSGDPAPVIEDYTRALAKSVVAQCERLRLPLPRLVIEPGRSLIARSIVALYSVVAIKRVPGVRTFVAVDGGMGDNIRPALYDARYTAMRADPVTHTASPVTHESSLAPHESSASVHESSLTTHERVTIVGRYCESGDVLLRDVELPPLEPGAIIAIPMAGAYTLSMASAYNLVPRPPLIMLRDGTTHLLQRRETWDDLMVRDQPLPNAG
jgi:diaminopimelate decarboxylase